MNCKQCFKCQKTKPIDQFYRHSEMKDGYLGKCKECTKADSKKDREENPEKISKRKAEYAQTEVGKEQRRKACQKHREKNKHQRTAYSKFRNALISGKVKKRTMCVVQKRKSRSTS